MKNPNSTDTANNLADTAHNLGNATREKWNEVNDSANDKFQEVKSSLGNMTDKASDLAHKGLASVKDTAERAKGAYQHYSEATCDYVAEKPMRSLLISAAIGAAVTALLMSGRHSERR